MANETSFPLSWPRNKKRTAAHRRKRGPFTTAKDRGWGTGSDGSDRYRGAQPITIAGAVTRLQHELRLLGARYIVISTNLELRQDGLPKSSQRRMQDDPGVAVYFRLEGDPVSFAVDQYIDVAQNIAAIAGHVAASRAIERYGVATLRQIFQGYMALPAAEAVNDWRALLNEPSTLAEARAAYYDAMRTAHPDTGGTEAAAAALNAAWAKAQEVLG